MNTSELKSKARELGADLIGVAPKSRWADWPAQSNPLSIMPACQSVIVVGRKILRGAFRGIEEGTNFGSTYGHYGHAWNEFTFLSRLIYNLAAAIETHGAEAVPMSGGTPKGENTVVGNAGIASNVRLDSKALAHAAGLGSIGKGGFFLTKQYGHRQRFGLILTDLELEGDPILDLDFCKDCDACIKACPLQAYSLNQDQTWRLNSNVCNSCTNGKILGSDLSGEPLDRLASACGRACLVALEDKIGEKFHHKFRKRAAWQRDIMGKATLIPMTEEGK
ncbi:MAG: epoxyqueuosine reductase [Lentisphaerae bacterium]|nr:epoxyqueuosine reductase [Lentisphaerota bacterium]